MHKKIFYLTLILPYFFACSQDHKKLNEELVKSDPRNYAYEIVAKGADIPWGMTWLPDGSMLVTEINGKIYRYKNGKEYTIEQVPEIYRNGQGGLLDIEVHPNYAETGWIYFTYGSKQGGGEGGNTTLARAKLKDDAMTDLEVLYKAMPNTKKVQHFGSRVRFDDKGFLSGVVMVSTV